VAVAIAIVVAVRARRDRRDDEDRVRFASIHSQCVALMNALDRYPLGSGATTIHVSRSILEQFQTALSDARLLNDAGVRTLAIGALDFRPQAEGPDWVDIHDPRTIRQRLAELASAVQGRVDPGTMPIGLREYKVPGRMVRLRNRLFGWTRGERWV
jgi:hypothetical protein